MFCKTSLSALSTPFILSTQSISCLAPHSKVLVTQFVFPSNYFADSGGPSQIEFRNFVRASAKYFAYYVNLSEMMNSE